ncbi:Phosphotransferase enzyme family protein [Bremerella volcania]|uniref:Phosphotransferase enzyme family protein n=1 Tax=Bremerella volcania TaxID=2527984 RepID=A0A518CAN2_9BACT|nr:phosphotransferase [Bremerella volcania]QDU76283.1 Phosphotransferase enzyme family protein [Bremerella volcania]
MTNHDKTLIQVLAAFQLPTSTVRGIVACEGGLSGSEVWKVETAQACYCLKLMPPDFSVNRLLAAHHAANDRRRRGMTYLAGYLPAASGQTYVQTDDRLWELQTWINGSPPTLPYTFPQKKAMFHAVAEFHDKHETPPKETDVSPGIQTRIQLCEAWRLKHVRGHFPSLHSFGQPQWKWALEQFLDSLVHYHPRLGPLLLSLEDETYLLEDCIADPRPENFRFQGDQLTGLFDLGSMRWDNIALDVSRMASEVSLDGEVDWEFAFQAVDSIRPLTPSEERLAIVLDAANVLLTGLNWVQWLVIDEIRFANCDHVSSRLSHLTDRLAKIEKHAAWKI